jgi:tripeptide aminopeptidase
MLKNKILERFLRYVAIDTRSCPNATQRPSSAGQVIFATMLQQELQQMGISNAKIDTNGHLTASLDSNTKKNVPAIGFLAHIDTAPPIDGKCKNPRITHNYNGKDIVLDEKSNKILSLAKFPELAQYQGKTIIHTDGSTLLGADDKAGVAEIVAAVEYLLQHPEIEHGKICIGFTSDEEIGTGIDSFKVSEFGADYAYTIDGGGIGELEYENFNAAQAEITITGLDVHPGYGKNKMINSQRIAMTLESMLPEFERPEYTEQYEGFFHLDSMEASVEETIMHYIIRDHDKAQFANRKAVLEDIVNRLNIQYDNCIHCRITDQYANMKAQIEPVMFLIDIAQQAMQMADITPRIQPIRGGTDGAKLSFMGLPCPNIFTGGHNFHGYFEYIVLESMEKAVWTIIHMTKLFATRRVQG